MGIHDDDDDDDDDDHHSGLVTVIKNPFPDPHKILDSKSIQISPLHVSTSPPRNFIFDDIGGTRLWDVWCFQDFFFSAVQPTTSG